MLKRPILSPQESILEDRKKQIRNLMEQCRSRRESIEGLINMNKPEDVLILLRRFAMDLCVLTGLIFDLKDSQDIIDKITSFSEKLRDQEAASLFLSMYSQQREMIGENDKKALRKAVCKLDHTGNKLFWILQKAYKRIQKDRMQTKMDRYRKHQLYFMIICLAFFIGAGSIFCSLLYFLEKENKEKTLADMNTLADVAFEAKRKTNRSLVKITGNTCSICVCDKIRSLKGLTAENACVQAWHHALEKICHAAGRQKGCTEKFSVDVWGSPYGLDENEREFGKDDTRQDFLRSAGPDRKFRTRDDLLVTIRNSFDQ